MPQPRERAERLHKQSFHTPILWQEGYDQRVRYVLSLMTFATLGSIMLAWARRRNPPLSRTIS